jgi:hypothetical protein
MRTLFGLMELRRFRPAPPPGGGGGDFGGGGGGGQAGGGSAGGGAAGGSGGSAGSSAGSGAPSGAGGGQNVYNLAPWLILPSDFLDIDKYGAVALPAIGATGQILQFKIPSGRQAKITGIGMDFQANGATGTGLYSQDVLPFQLEFTLTTDAIGTGFGDFSLFNYMPGSVSDPMGIAGLMCQEGQTITLSVENVSVVLAAPTQFIGAHIQGYSFPSVRNPKLGYQ